MILRTLLVVGLLTAATAYSQPLIKPGEGGVKILVPVPHTNLNLPELPSPLRSDLPVHDKPLRPVGLIPPKFPSEAEARHQDGYVDLDFIIDLDGAVRDIKIVGEEPAGLGFAQEALKVFGKWKFSPLLSDGKPAVSTAVFRMTFRAL